MYVVRAAVETFRGVQPMKAALDQQAMNLTVQVWLTDDGWSSAQADS